MQKQIVITGTRGIPHIMGGVEAVVEEIAPRLVSLGYDVTVVRRKDYISPLANNDTELVQGERFWKGVRLVDIDSPKKKSLEAFVHTWRAIRYAKKSGAEVVHINAVGPALITPFARLLGLKVVFHHHGPDYDRDKWGFVAKTALKAGEWMGCKFANHTMVISDVIQKIVDEKCHVTKNVSLVYNGVGVPSLCHEPEYFEKLGIEEGKYILGMCRFVPEKHLHDLVAAYTSLKTTGRLPEGVKLVLAGDTDFEDDYSRGLKRLAHEAGVVLTGFVQGNKKFSLLTNAICYSLPSSHEGLPIALLEAMSYQLPVITSAIPANLEVGLTPYDYITNSDNQPLNPYHEVGDVKALEKNIELIVKASLECQVNTGAPLRRMYDMGKYDWDRIARDVSEVYESLYNTNTHKSITNFCY